MSRGRKIALIVLGSLAGLALVAVIAGIVVVQTPWFHQTVRDKLVSTVEESTGGRAEVGAFDFDWKHLRAVVRDFVLHGTEPPGSPPLFRARLLQVDLKLLTPVRKIVDIAALLVDSPQANVIVYPDGSTNIPSPKIRKPSERSALETVVDLAVGRFDLRNGSLTLAERKMPLDARGENLRAQLFYDAAGPSYKGHVSMAPLLMQSPGNAPVNVNITLPVVLEKDAVRFNEARLATPASQVVITGALENMKAPRFSGRVNARVALDDVRRAAGLRLDTSGNAPAYLTADIAANADDQRIQVSNAHVALGRSNLQASGVLKGNGRPSGLNFEATLALGEIARLFRSGSLPREVVRAGGTVRMPDNRTVDLTGLRVAALGGAFAGSAGLENMERFRVSGNLSGFGIRELASAFTAQPPPYSGVVSGPVEASGSLKTPRAMVASARLAIAPGARGIPVSGRLNADYNGAADTVNLERSWIAMPHSRLDLSGTLGNRVDVRLVSRDLRELAPGRPLPVSLAGGAATFNGAVTGRLSAPRATGHLQMTNFRAGDSSFSLLAADVDASPSGASVRNGALTRGQLRAAFDASVGMHGWKPLPRDPLAVNATVRNADVSDVLALAGRRDVPVTGALTADARISGTVGDPRGSASLSVVNGSAWQQPLDRLDARAVLDETSIAVPALTLTSGEARISASADYSHAKNNLRQGTLRAQVASSQVALERIRALVEKRPGLAGTASLNATASAAVQPVRGQTRVELTALDGSANVRNLQMQGKKLGDFTADARTSGGALVYRVNSDFAGSVIRVNGRSMLTGDHATTADASIANLPIDQVLAVAGRTDIPASGTLNAGARLSGTLDDPRAQGRITVTKALYQKMPFDRLEASLNYTNGLVEVPSLLLTSGPARLEANASLTHPPGDFQSGLVRVHLATNRFDLANVRPVQMHKAGVRGTVNLRADATATLRRGAAPLISVLNAGLAADNLTMDHKPLGSLTATAVTRGTELTFDLKSDFARADIRGNGRMDLRGDYPLNAQLSFANVTYAGLENWIAPAAPRRFDALAEGQATVEGPAARPDDLRGTLRLARLEMRSVLNPAVPNARRTVQLRNAEPIVLALDRGVARVQSFRLTGPYTNLNVTGTARIAEPRTLDLRAGGNIGLEAAEAFNENIFSSGTVVLNASVRGTGADPVINGQLDLRNASFNMADVPNGIANANGSILFNGREAVIRNITGETGGGKITLTGVAGYSGPAPQFRLQATADKVRIQEPPNVSTQASANLSLTGTSERSLLSGTVTVYDVAFHSHSDIGSMLSQTAKPPSVPQAKTGLLGGLRFDVRIDTAPDVQFRTTLAQDIQAEAHLRLRGTPSRPGMLGRVTVSQGELVFFGSKYTLDNGSLAFYDPQRINPIVNIDLETEARGIQVQLNVAGPMDRMRLTYRSDPPLRFNEIVSLLATGKAPTSDPVLAAREPAAPQQSFEQMGASTLLGQAVANPVSGRLQRLFGVSKLKIDPQITGAQNTPQARLTLQQQISKELTFTYIQDVTQSNPQIIRIEWAFDPAWEAIAERQENGEFGLDFFYKKRFR